MRGNFRALSIGLCLSLMALLSYFASLTSRGEIALPPSFALTKLGQLRKIPLLKGASPEMAAQALRAAPLSFDPFFAAGFQPLLAGRPIPSKQAAQTSLPYLREALRRDPHAPQVRAAIVQPLLLTGQTKAAYKQLAAFERLAGENAQNLMNIIAKSITDYDQLDQLMPNLAPYPNLSLPLIRGLIQAGKPPALIAYALYHLPDAQLNDPDVRSLAIAQWASAGDYQSARELWPNGAANGIFSPDFTDFSAPPPFGWQLSANAAGAAERLSPAGINLASYGRSSGLLLSQLLTLPAGAYQITVDGQQISTPSETAEFALRLRCAGNGQIIIAQNLRPNHKGANQFTLALNVPQSACGGQYLEFTALGNGTPHQLQLSHIALRPAQL